MHPAINPIHPCRRSSAATLGAALGLLGLGLNASAQSLPTPVNVVSLNASATLEVPKDWLTVVFSTTREGVEAASVQTQLRQALDTALAEARKVAKPGQLEVQTGAFALFPRYQPPTPKQAAAGQAGGISGWQGSTELLVEGRDTASIAQLTARIQTLSIARVSSGLSREAREKVEAEVTAQAIERFRSRAQTVTQQFGFSSYTVREVQIGSELPMPAAAPMEFRAMKLNAASADASLPVEVGKATVSVNVGGSVQMK